MIWKPSSGAADDAAVYAAAPACRRAIFTCVRVIFNVSAVMPLRNAERRRQLASSCSFSIPAFSISSFCSAAGRVGMPAACIHAAPLLFPVPRTASRRRGTPPLLRLLLLPLPLTYLAPLILVLFSFLRAAPFLPMHTEITRRDYGRSNAPALRAPPDKIITGHVFDFLA